MLVELIIRDLALIEHAQLALGPGLNVITGETGAGKSLLVGALELLLGQRPRGGVVRTGAEKASVEGRFAVASGRSGASVARWARRNVPQLIEDWTEAGERELILSRQVAADGRTRAYVNGRPVTRQALADLAPRLFDIHGQNDHQKLHDPAEQLRLLDGFGKLDADVAAYRAAREAWQRLVDEATRIERERSARRDRIELVRFQLEELAAAAPEADEKSRLAPERELLRNAAGLQQGLAELLESLEDADGAATDRVKHAQRVLESWRARIAALEDPCADLERAGVHLSDAVRALRSLADRLESDPRRLEQVEERLAELERLERKHRTDAAGLVALRRELESELRRLESDEEKGAGLGEHIAAARAAVLERAAVLRRERKALAAKLVQRVTKTLDDLGLGRAQFDVKLGQRGEADGITAPDPADPAVIEQDRARFGERGMDRIEFVLAANPGEASQKLRAVASGGETARIMLALRSVLSHAGESRTLLFDEIDAGVGGRLGPVVGAHLRKLGEHHQVLCVTHLPAIAAMAQQHLKVSKVVQAGRTHTRIEPLSGEARVHEVADMISGGADQPTAKAEARRLLGPSA
jgi:DNA repair protein RecN (Recombination protein N)